MRYQFCFVGGQDTETYTQKTFLFGIVGGKEIPVYKLDKMGKVEFLNAKSPKKLFNASKGKIAEYPDVSTYTTNIKYWKLFQSASSFGVQRRMFSLYLELKDEPTLPASIITPACLTDIFKNSLLSMTETSLITCNHIFISRFRLLNRSELPSILGPPALKWAKLTGMPSINLLRDMIYVDKKSVRHTGRMIRLMK